MVIVRSMKDDNPDNHDMIINLLLTVINRIVYGGI